TIEELTNQPIHWQHIDKTGFGCVVMDMNSRLVEGFGRYLSDREPRKHNWQWHVKRVIVYGVAHFQRAITHVIGAHGPKTDLGREMELLLFAPSKQEYVNLCFQLMGKLVYVSDVSKLC
ncbi:hypothetical protein DH86_00001427, partial [Scytalidium sp. 3C]